MSDPARGVTLAEIRESLAFEAAIGQAWTAEKQAKLDSDIQRENERLAAWKRQHKSMERFHK